MPRKFNLPRWFKYKYVTVMRLKDHPGSIAMGAALGISFDVLPTFGLGVFAAYFVARMLKANAIATVIAAVVFKLALPFFAYANVQTGQIFIKEDITAVPDVLTASLFHVDWSYLGFSFLLGSVINAVLVYLVTYLVVYKFVCWRRRRGKPVKI